MHVPEGEDPITTKVGLVNSKEGLVSTKVGLALVFDASGELIAQETLDQPVSVLNVGLSQSADRSASPLIRTASGPAAQPPVQATLFLTPVLGQQETALAVKVGVTRPGSPLVESIVHQGQIGTVSGLRVLLLVSSKNEHPDGDPGDSAQAAPQPFSRAAPLGAHPPTERSSSGEPRGGSSADAHEGESQSRGAKWQVHRSGADLLVPGDEGLLDFLVESAGWLTSSNRVFLQSLEHFLAQFRRALDGSFAFLALAREGGVHVFATDGLGHEQALRILSQLPETMTESLLKAEIKTILPDILREDVSPESTFFHKGLRSVVGFPAIAEGKIWGFVFVGFSNILMTFTPQKRMVAELAASYLALFLQRAGLREQLTDVRQRYNTAALSAGSGRLILGASEPMKEMFRVLEKVAPFSLSVLITGETGVGKELAAGEIHRLSAYHKGPLVSVNAAALPEALVESELFGHARGAFTGAVSEKRGYIEAASGGTLFIDEIGELSIDIQTKLLRVLQEKAVIRVGETQARQVDFRLVVATHRNLNERIQNGQFREDLYYRIAGATLEIPPLRVRGRDVVLLARYFISRFAARHGLPEKELSAQALSCLEDHPWPGNVRELQNAVERAFVMSDGLVIRARDFGWSGEPEDAESAESANSGRVSLSEAKDRWLTGYLSKALGEHGGSRTDTARALGISERTLFRYLEQLGIRQQTRSESL